MVATQQIANVCRVRKSPPSELNQIRKQIQQVMIAKALRGDVRAARYVPSLAKEEESYKAGKQNRESPRVETREERIVCKAIERLPHNVKRRELEAAQQVQAHEPLTLPATTVATPDQSEECEPAWMALARKDIPDEPE